MAESQVRAFNRLTTTRYGQFLYNQNDTIIGRSLEIYGEVNEIELSLLRALCGPGSCIFDVGANIGDHTVPLAQHVGKDGFVYAFEPQRVVFQTLCANVALNDLQNVECVHAAVGATHGFVPIPDIDYTVAFNYGAVELAQFPGGRPVRRLMLDDFCHLTRVDLMKIDVEGMEADVVTGGRNFLRRFRPKLYVENDRIEKSEELINLLKDLDYRLFWHTAPIFNANNFRGVREDAFGGVSSCNMLCLPRELELGLRDAVEIDNPREHPALASWGRALG